ncbi:hypothetical protein BX600DRAFT_475190 [Xylariales sp. PMI_506]|nr:hypothetical protein BX600DRAFT_475190 [Xylariales sp. PMI_506]
MGVSSKDSNADLDVSGSVATASDERPRRSKSEKVKGEKDRERDREGHHRHQSTSHKSSKPSRSSKLAGADGDSSSVSYRRHRTREEKERDREKKGRDRSRERQKKTASMSDLVPEMSKSMLTESRVSLPYPSFSKAHSREAVGSREEVSSVTTSAVKKGDPLTPDPTDLSTKEEKRRSKSADEPGSGASSRKSSTRKKDGRPPSPPETDVSGEKRRSHISTSRLSPSSDRPSSRTSGLSRSSSRRDDKSKLSSKSKTSSQATFVKSPTSYPPHHSAADSALSDDKTAGARSAATSVLPKRSSSKKSRRSDPLDDDSPESVQDSSPKTPTATPHFPPAQTFPSEKHLPHAVRLDETERLVPAQTPVHDFGPPPPPPPPPPTLNIQEVPRVDYLLQNGGLMHPLPRHFLSVLPRQNGSRPSNPPLAGAETLFAPFFNLLDQYQTVIHKQGSVAVATGHKSVARRLLDRLEDVFSRDLPADGCSCIMCEKTQEEHRGLGWGEVLERVGGRVEIPKWPPFDVSSLGVITAEQLEDIPPRPSSPIKLDPDIAEEFREHYLRQSKKTKSVVDKWLNVCAETPAPPPSEVDDETFTFAILTNLDQGERPYFNALLSGARELSATVRAPTPNVRKPRPEFLVKVGLSLQRLYRLPQAPRDAETAMYLIKNPFHHDLLVTIADISPQEWEILTSGRFDGFLWSGADGDDGTTPTAEHPGSRGATPFFSPPPSRPSTGGFRQTPGFSASRNTTPFSGVYSRGGTPASFISLSSSATHSRQAVSHDEEVEMAALAEVEREIYQGMEALEDAFERLHHRAEMVRNALRQRNAGLMMSMQNRRSGVGIDVLPQLSGGSAHDRAPWDDETSESDWGGDDMESLAPDDSASNISSSRHRRPKRRTERRTPAPIEEDEEEI